MLRQQLKRFKGRFPKIHLIAATLCASLTGLTLTLLPSEDVSATRSTLPLELPQTTRETQPLALLTPTLQEAQSHNTHQTDSANQTDSTVTTSTPADSEQWQHLTIGSGDTLSSLFKQVGLSSRDVYSVTNAARHNKGLSRIFPGQTLSFLIENNELKKLRLKRTELVTTYVEKTDSGYVSQIIERKPDIQHRFASGVINSSLFIDGEKAGLSNRLIMELAGIFGWDVDFVLDIRKGDSFSVIYEERYLDGRMIGEGKIIAAQFTNRDRLITAVHFTDSEGNSSYYTPQGQSMRKAFLRTPVDFTRISSRFSLSRKHPVLNRIRAHKGVDYAARTGTPIKAAGDGKIIWRARKGGFGRAVIVQHGSGITTLYAHMSRYRKGQKQGSRVKQGDVIGYVGQSGLASGPHLHYEFRVNGQHKNPMKVKFPNAAPVPKSDRDAFNAVAATLMTQLESYKTTQLATAGQ